MSQPAPKGNFINIFLFAAMIFLGWQLFFQKPAPDPFRLRPGDTVQITIDSKPPKHARITVQPDQSLTVPDVGAVKDASRTMGDLEAELNKQYQDKNGVNAPAIRVTLDSTTVLETMRRMNTQILDHSILTENSKLVSRIDEEVRNGQISKEEGEKRKLEGTVLVGNTQYRAGILWPDFARLTAAFNTLHNVDRGHLNDPVWAETQFQLGPHPKFPETTVTGRAFTKKVVDELSARSKTDKVFGLFPGYELIDALVAMTGRVPGFSYWFAGLLLALVVRLAVFPLAAKQYKFGRMMGQLSPLMTELRAEYTDKKTKQITNQAELQQKTMALYGEYGINPMQGCWPMFIQIPFFLLIYQCMVHYQFEFQKGVFLWVNPGASAATNGFIAPNLGERDYILIAIYAISMIITTLMAPVTTSDPVQAKQGRIMGIGVAILFSVMMFFWPLPSAFVLYWVFTNIFATAHMLYAYRQPLPPLQKVNAPNGGLFPFGNTIDPKGSAPKNGVAGTNGAPKVRTGTPVKHRPKKKK